MENFKDDVIKLLKKHKIISDGYLLTDVRIQLDVDSPVRVEVDGFII